MKDTAARRQPNWPWLLLLLTLLLGLIAFVLFMLNRSSPVPAAWGSAGGPREGLGNLLNALVQSFMLPATATAFGILILRSQPQQRIGWLLVAIGLYSALASAVAEWAVYGNYTSPETLPGAELAAWVTNWAWIILMTLALLTVALFPSGRFLSSRWRMEIGLSLLFFAGPGLVGTSMESPMSSAFLIPNPYFDISEAAYDVLFFIVVLFLLGSTVLALLQMAARFRRSRGIERDQLKWLLAGATVSALMIFTGIAMATDLFSRTAFRADWVSEVGAFMVNASVLAPLVGMGIAMMRYQLYDIDFIIRRTTSYAVVTALLVLVYFGTVVVLQRAFASVTGQTSTVAVVLSTLLIAALFLPLRRRVQDAIDKRFFRRKYDAEKVLNAFAATVRDETDLDELTAELVRVIQETMQPEFVSVWLKPVERIGDVAKGSPSGEAYR